MKKNADFWNEEYQTSEHLALSAEPAEDLQKFARWLERTADPNPLAPKYGGGKPDVLDLGTGNGRNLVWLSQAYGCRGTGYDLSTEAIAQATRAAEGLPLSFEARSIAVPPLFPFANESFDVVLDMMTSHFLAEAERAALRDEIARLIRPGGYLFFKTFLAEEDQHVARLLREHPANEKGSYIHPEIGVMEHVYSEKELKEFFEPLFEIRKIDKSHKHIDRAGNAWKRRTVSVYLEKKW